ncbi:MAG: C40 family peptidase [Pseudomonadota bacterium]
MIAHKPISRLPFVALIVALAAALAGCSWGPVVPEDGPPERVAGPRKQPAVDVGGKAAHFALLQRGVPYRYGGATPQGFDCSGLVHYAFGRAGKHVPRTTTALHRASKTVAKDALRPGDLVFFRVDGKMAHVGIVVDENRFVHAPRSGRLVSVETLDSPFYRQAFVRGGRLH